jgi:hypothetical protein
MSSFIINPHMTAHSHAIECRLGLNLRRELSAGLPKILREGFPHIKYVRIIVKLQMLFCVKEGPSKAECITTELDAATWAESISFTTEAQRPQRRTRSGRNRTDVWRGESSRFVEWDPSLRSCRPP